jgi:ribosomal-protein-alanine N-acetyltransferase
MSTDGLDVLFSEFPVLRAGDLELRQVAASDTPDVFPIFSDPEVVQYYDLDPLETLGQAQEMIERWADRFQKRQAIRWGITVGQEEHVIGTCGLFIQSAWKGGLGYDLARPYWRQGIMTKALGRVIRFAFDTVELNRLEALVIPGNVASERLLGKLGFTREGLLREYMFFKGRHQDLNCYSLLRSDLST